MKLKFILFLLALIVASCVSLDSQADGVCLGGYAISFKSEY